jgi:hypothetical protein
MRRERFGRLADYVVAYRDDEEVCIGKRIPNQHGSCSDGGCDDLIVLAANNHGCDLMTHSMGGCGNGTTRSARSNDDDAHD